MLYRQSSFPLSFRLSTIQPASLLPVLVLTVGLMAFPLASWAQFQAEAPPNFCTTLQQSPRTSGAKSALSGEWNASENSWEPQTRTVQTFNGDGSTLTELTIQELSGGTWRDTARATPTYNASDRLDLCTLETINEQGNYVNAFRIDFEYDASGRLDVRISEFWDSDAGEWVNFTRSTLGYDADGNNTSEVVEGWNAQNQTWVKSHRFLREYNDPEDRITLERREAWDIASQSYQNARRSQYTYESNSTTVVEETWEGSWVNDSRHTTTLNSSDLPTQTVVENWNGSDWVRDERTTNSYTTHNNTEKFDRIVVEEWDASANEWLNARRTRFSYTDVIPVELAGLEAQRIGTGTVRLTWQTASETNNSGFHVQRRVSDAETSGARSSESSPSWTSIDFIEGAGTTSKPQSYRFTDQAVPYEADVVRYRLKQVDLNGTSHLSDAVEVRLAPPNRLALQTPFPNPAQGQATVRYALPEATEVQVALYDMLGRRVATPVDGQKAAGRAHLQLRTQGLPSGTYFLRLQTSKQTRTRRLTVVE